MINSLPHPMEGALQRERNRQMASAHLEALNARHALLDGKIAAEMSRPVPDSATIGQLKRQKLKVKEEIQRGA